jgi:hypothetical protein
MYVYASADNGAWSQKPTHSGGNGNRGSEPGCANGSGCAYDAGNADGSADDSYTRNAGAESNTGAIAVAESDA